MVEAPLSDQGCVRSNNEIIGHNLGYMYWLMAEVLGGSKLASDKLRLLGL